MLYALLLILWLWVFLYTFVPDVLVPLISGTSWSDWPEKSRSDAVFYMVCVWGGIVASAVFHGLTGRFAEGWEGIACCVLVWIWINRVTIPFLDSNEFWLPWSPRDEKRTCGHQAITR